MTQGWRWFALVCVGSALALGSTALAPNANLAAHRETHRHAHIHSDTHARHLLVLPQACLWCNTLFHQLDHPPPPRHTHPDGQEPFHNLFLVEVMPKCYGFELHIVHAGNLGLANTVIDGHDPASPTVGAAYGPVRCFVGI